jgi:transposase
MWTSKNRARYNRSKLRYPSDLTDDEWGLVEPLIPPGKTGGGKRTVIMREVVNGLMYILSTGCQWRATPKDLPPKSSVYDYFDLWTYHGTLERIHHALYEQCRERAQREASPTDCYHRQPKREKRGKRRACIDPDIKPGDIIGTFTEPGIKLV